MKTYFTDSRENKAALLLASMSPDMVQDIVNLVSAKGGAIVSRLAEVDEGAPLRPLALFSREYISDEDFPFLYLGAMTALLSQFRTLSQDNDFYEKVLKGAFALDDDLAAKMASTIETRDPIGGYKNTPYAKSMAWHNRVLAVLQEKIRRGANWIAGALPFGWENDQDQKWDFDFLYELALLGKAVDELSSRARLMRSQYLLANNTGLFGTPKAYGDVYGDPEEAAEAAIINAVTPLVGSPIPRKILGGMAGFVDGAIKAANKKVDAVVARGAAGAAGTSPDPEIGQALTNILSSNPSAISQLNPAVVGTSVMSALAETLRQKAAQGDVSNSYETVRELYGEPVAAAWNRADLPTVFHEIAALAGDAYETTGDPEFDQAIIADTLQDDSLRGDVSGDEDPEIGGLFRRARINKNMRKAARLNRKNQRKQSRITRRQTANDALVKSRAAVDQARFSAPTNFQVDDSDDQLYSQEDNVPEVTDFDEGTYSHEEAPFFDQFEV